MESSLKESRIILALKALEKDLKLSVRAAAKIYDVPRSTLQTRRDGVKSRRDISVNSKKLTDLEEKVLLERIVDLDTRGFSPRLTNVQEMANRLCMDRDALRVGL